MLYWMKEDRITFHLIYNTFKSLDKWQRYYSFTKSVPNRRSLTLMRFQIIGPSLEPLIHLTILYLAFNGVDPFLHSHNFKPIQQQPTPFIATLRNPLLPINIAGECTPSECNAYRHPGTS